MDERAPHKQVSRFSFYCFPQFSVPSTTVLLSESRWQLISFPHSVRGVTSHHTTHHTRTSPQPHRIHCCSPCQDQLHKLPDTTDNMEVLMLYTPPPLSQSYISVPTWMLLLVALSSISSAMSLSLSDTPLARITLHITSAELVKGNPHIVHALNLSRTWPNCH